MIGSAHRTRGVLHLIEQPLCGLVGKIHSPGRLDRDFAIGQVGIAFPNLKFEHLSEGLVQGRGSLNSRHSADFTPVPIVFRFNVEHRDRVQTSRQCNRKPRTVLVQVPLVVSLLYARTDGTSLPARDQGGPPQLGVRITSGSQTQRGLAGAWASRRRGRPSR